VEHLSKPMSLIKQNVCSIHLCNTIDRSTIIFTVVPLIQNSGYHFLLADEEAFSAPSVKNRAASNNSYLPMLGISADALLFVFKGLCSTISVPTATNMIFTLRNISLSAFALLISQVAAVPNPQATGPAVMHCEFGPLIHSLLLSKDLGRWRRERHSKQLLTLSILRHSHLSLAVMLHSSSHVSEAIS